MKVAHDVPGHRFTVQLPEGSGELVYSVQGPQVLNLLHTEVSQGLRGRGAGDALVTAAVEFARRNGDKIIPTCPYVRAWLGRHPEYQDLRIERPPSQA
jgi:uncharacterized protein